MLEELLPLAEPVGAMVTPDDNDPGGLVVPATEDES